MSKPNFDPKSFKAGGAPPGAAYLNSVNAEIRRLGGKFLEDGSAYPNEPRATLFFQITGGPDANGGYSWTGVYQTSPNTWAAYPTPITGGPTTSNAAYALDGSLAAADDTVYLGAPAPSGLGWIFQGGGGGKLFIPAVTAGTFASGSYTTPTSGNVKLLSPNPSGGPGMVAAATTTPAYNTYPLNVPLASGVFTWLTSWNGYLYLVTAACSPS